MLNNKWVICFNWIPIFWNAIKTFDLRWKASIRYTSWPNIGDWSQLHLGPALDGSWMHSQSQIFFMSNFFFLLGSTGSVFMILKLGFLLLFWVVNSWSVSLTSVRLLISLFSLTTTKISSKMVEMAIRNRIRRALKAISKAFLCRCENI